ncbi:MAG: hypothetical protein JNN27_23185 [Planctomycetes bacterium]|nr:hypothetical protein [Planctomycetota bacterium]
MHNHASNCLRGGALALLAALCGPLAGCGSCRADLPLIARASLETPRGTVEAFAAYLRSGLHEFEYRCFSVDFTRRNQLSLFTYAEGREELARKQPWLELFAHPKIVGEVAHGGDRHDVDVRLGGRTFRVNLVREESFEIRAGEDTLASDLTRLDERVALEATANGKWEVVARLPIADADIDLSSVSAVVLRSVWKIDGVTPWPEPAPTP